MTTRIKIFIIVLVAGLAACESLDTDYESFLHDGEIVYPGVPINVFYRPGNQRLALAWQPSPDPSIVKYMVYWNNHRDSLEVEASSHDPADTMTVSIPGLQEYVYNFTVHAYDAKGHKSVPLEVENARAYGPVYAASLFNRRPDGQAYTMDGNNIPTLHFVQGDTIHVATVVEYTNQAGVRVEQSLQGEGTAVTLDGYQPGTVVRYRSSYIPVSNAIDTFYVTRYDTFPPILTPLNKALFSEVHLPNDVNVYESGTSVSKLWDGSVGPQGYPNIYHSDGNSAIPHHFTFDLGQVFENLAQLEETGRDCCNNPDRFEVWGIDDLTDAETTLPGNDPGWKDEAIAKGWTLLREVTRNDDGKAPFKVDLLEGAPPVRYIRIRVLHVTTNDSYYSNMSELTFWRK
ncbi:DUF4998 domain-containing protein [Parachryseolinea silvisoli]|uniref:DUF4998 domain-containing protein n=1 Tax=Parachryseolinea silvisoli TaxID=2873601 RepID=UPI002265CED5|nr:DUF4998 domain-containing protein [Parachryseolinea silvisoli]MCD9018939.1 fibronectin type III domain-containing protein [Parachryseolinea silvisoli]